MVGGRITAEDLSFKGNVVARDAEEAAIKAQSSFGRGFYAVDELKVAPDVWMALNPNYDVLGFVNARDKKEAASLSAQRGFGEDAQMEQVTIGQKVWAISEVRSSAIPPEQEVNEPNQPPITEPPITPPTEPPIIPPVIPPVIPPIIPPVVPSTIGGFSFDTQDMTVGQSIDLGDGFIIELQEVGQFPIPGGFTALGARVTLTPPFGVPAQEILGQFDEGDIVRVLTTIEGDAVWFQTANQNTQTARFTGQIALRNP